MFGRAQFVLSFEAQEYVLNRETGARNHAVILALDLHVSPRFSWSLLLLLVRHTFVIVYSNYLSIGN